MLNSERKSPRKDHSRNNFRLASGGDSIGVPAFAEAHLSHPTKKTTKFVDKFALADAGTPHTHVVSHQFLRAPA
jgi:hypothetical protein